MAPCNSILLLITLCMYHLTHLQVSKDKFLEVRKMICPFVLLIDIAKLSFIEIVLIYTYTSNA